ncbi:hypothetical protein A3H80_04020 [Candidatus Roizmanbacteria bacterium RIFCSPLOWO2_02_FULL_37_19]|uniref:Uncharacterized protein n=1 Tax=Candidatus Roizmanbacteria bacterium RIFCSPHIGHO2_02_FULL_37_24 TaxID=1802037 RepID=A0A1F7GVU0_9BACT|nr:MAG: hypothetical protein A2862_04455 [Candidatus Roizmanbacteria bacterium RIFCSPHIGHO2_01_FULL_38_41]OGK23187.1 MAG: hypothetical protein A3C24_00830 [Candidatus Roizmanbacteria bacterium RIFCSPHIGHO2_02_FULL_37_24]OGK33831.1 MAG: hypothetical protein A3E10_05430 [Candidatus Roizmanbacteria bacterium RIFCSPHIGHO2_12_FULL_37_23]OGK43892.1 MAG: hypothetical protein A2956_01815 [Candidatus Roizmanbacteria bacterium RIFCSPLOWO2_01_FULL_37_57]OGK53675.1 MAG: hypothetical protein A3H80_04020 [Ca
MKTFQIKSWYFYPLIGLALFMSLILVLYKGLAYFGIQEKLDYTDKTIFVEWIRVAVHPKQYFKIFYNLSIFLLPLGASGIGYVIYKKHTSKN